MRVLLLTTDAPAPRHVNGGTTRQYKLFSRLLELGHEVTVVGVFAAREDPYIEELREEGFRVIAHERPASRMRERLAAAGRQTAIAEYDWRALGDRYAAAFESVIAGSKPRLVVSK
ncbi:MAG: hypothetical protein JHD02_01820 [Thermoleophilaceae bacterium]|nr:hypothetical protein [Thermoleophilaceae bacterium]